MVTPETNNINTHKLDKHGRNGIIINLFFIFLSIPVLFISAGTIYWINGWVYFGVILSYEIVYIFILMKINPGLLNQRGKFVKKDTKPFDKIYIVLYLPISYLILIIAGFDAVRYQWSTIAPEISFLGLISTIIAFYLSFWAISVNSYFECTVLVQKDQTVCSSGPYHWVRHPGYAAGIVSVLSAPLILGSLWALVPSTVIAFMFIIRTALEDQTLKKELEGYTEYTKTTRYRLIPFIW